MEQTFDIQDALALLEPCGVVDKYFTVDEHGVWPTATFDKTDEVASNFEQWRPALVFSDDAHAPDLPPRKSAARTPALPPKFNARELAAFMIDGWGVMVADHYGEWVDGPRLDSLKVIPACEDLARLAVKSAFDARREAQKIVGAPPLELEAEADRARKAYNAANEAANIREGVSDSIPGTDDSRDRRARAVASIAQQDAEMEATALAWKLGYEKWLNAMVRQLLKPAPVQSPETLVAVETDELDYTLVATRTELIEVFGKFTGMDKSWFDNLTSSPKLMAARKFTGQGGRHSAEPLFCPYEVTQWLADPKRKKGKPLTDTTAWRLLKSQFPKVYNRYSIGDPNTV